MVRGLLVALVLTASPAAPGADRRTPVVEAVERATPSVVTIEVEVVGSSPFLGWSEASASQGSGVVLRADGLVLTNAHVVEGARGVAVHTVDGRTWPATVVALESTLDLAVLQLEGARDLPTATVGDSDELMLGETVIAIGNPYGLGLTVSTGVVSSIRRDVAVGGGLHQSFIQTDAAINPGNSGGALVDLEGRVIGINTAIHEGAEGIGFAIPVNRARKIAEDLVTHGTVRIPWLGIDVRDVDPRALRGTPLREGAVVVHRVWRGGPGDQAEMREGDVVFEVGGRPVGSRADLNARLAELVPGASLSVRYVRGREERTGRVVSASAPGDLGERALRSVVGIEVAGGGEKPLVVTRADPRGSWVASRLRVGDVIVAVDGQPVSSRAELAAAVLRAKSRHRPHAVFTVVRGRYPGHVQVGI